MNRRRTTVVIGATVGVLAGLMGVQPVVPQALAACPAACAPQARASLTAAQPPKDLRISLTELTPRAALRPGERLVISGRVVNTGTRPVGALSIELLHRVVRLSTRAQVRAWLDGSDADPGAATGVTVGLGRLAPGQVAGFTLTATTDQLRLPGNRFGPRGVTVRVLSGTQTLGDQRTSVIWMPAANTFAPTPVALLAPVTSRTPIGAGAVEDTGNGASGGTDPNSTDSGGTDPSGTQGAEPDSTASADGTDTTGGNDRLDRAATELAADGRLSRVVNALAGQPISWAIDPALLQLAQGTATGLPSLDGPATPPAGTASAGTPSIGPSSAGTGLTPSSTTPRTTAIPATPGQAWLAAVGRLLPVRTSWLLPYADPDLAAATRATAPELITLAQDRAQEIAKKTLQAVPPATLAWPADGLADRATLALANDTGHRAVVLDGTDVPPVEPSGNTQSAVATLRAGPASIRTLLYDPWLSSAFAATGGDDPAGATQRLLAELAALTLERPFDPQPQLLTTPRDWDPQPGGVRAAVAALAEADWVRITPATALVTARPGTAARDLAPYPAQAQAAELPTAELSTLAGLERRLARFSTALPDPAPVIVPRRDQLLRLTSASWRVERARHAAAVKAAGAQVAEVSGGPQVVEGGPFNLLTGSGELPLRVQNPHPFAMQVQLRLRPRSGQVVADRVISLNLPPSGTRRVLVPVRSVADGAVTLDALLSSPSGVPVSTPTPILVRVHRNWETRGILALATLLGTVLLVGLARSVRRGRPRVRPHDVPDADDLELYGPARANDVTHPPAVVAPGPGLPVPDRGDQ